MAEGDVRITISGDCGHQFEVSIVGHDPHTMEFACPECGAVDRFTPENAAAIVEQYGKVRGELDKMLRDIARGSKVLKYRPKR